MFLKESKFYVAVTEKGLRIKHVNRQFYVAVISSKTLNGSLKARQQRKYIGCSFLGDNNQLTVLVETSHVTLHPC